MATAKVTMPDGKVANITGDESNIKEFLSSLPDAGDVNSEQPQEQPKKDSLGVYTNQGGGNLLSRIPSANREFLRSLGTGKDPIDAYMSGLENPNQSESFQQQLLRTGIIPDSKGTTSTLNSFLGGVAGQMADTVTSPLGAILMSMDGTTPKQAASAFKSVGKGVSGMFNKVAKPSVEEILAMANQAKNESSGMEAVINRTQQADSAMINSKYSTMKQQLGSDIKKLSDVDIKKAADEATRLNRGDRFFNWAKDLSKRYGADYEKAIVGQKIGTQDWHSVVGGVLKERGMIDETGQLLRPQSSWSSSEKQVYDYYNKVGSMLPGTASKPTYIMTEAGPIPSLEKTGKETLDLSSIDKDLKSIFLSKEGKQYSSGDHILTQLRSGASDALPNSGALKVVKAKFRPELQAKNEAIKVLQPFNRSGDFDTTAGTNFFSRYANGKAKPDEIRWVEAMKKINSKEGNIFQDLDTLSSQKNKMIKDMGDLEQLHAAELKGNILGHQQSLAENQMATENHLGMLDAFLKNAEKDKAVSDLVKTGAKWGTKLLVGGSLAGAGFKVGEALIPHK